MNQSKRMSLTIALTGVSLASAVTARAALIESLPLNGTATAQVGLDGTAVNGPVATVGYDGTLNGATAFQPVSYFGNYVSVPEGGGLSGASQGTIAMWVRWNGLQNQTAVESLYGSVTGRQVDGASSDDVIALNGADPNSANVSFWFNNQTGVGLTGTTAVGDGVWHYLAVTFTPTAENLYLDGSLDASVTGTFGLNSVNDAPLTIGAWTGSANGYSNSDIADFQVFDTALTQQQVITQQATSAVPEPASVLMLTAAGAGSLGRRRFRQA